MKSLLAIFICSVGSPILHLPARRIRCPVQISHIKQKSACYTARHKLDKQALSMIKSEIILRFNPAKQAFSLQPAAYA
ncbi:MAG: hypothetical protein D6730_08755 [Bacteroidetes bacterium]|nr:MAG: hypothetical protein D6730_08755 [Bacteroidota bacterium]